MTADVQAPLKLIALDSDDLSIISAHMQDAVAKVADMAYLRQEKRFAMLIDRFDWISAVGEGTPLRRRTGVHFDRVQNARVRGFELREKDKQLNLLAVEFVEKDAPAGAVTLFFSGDAAIQLEVECLEAAISDLGPAWPAERPRGDES
jgi:Protein of unknown function (DUF2948)